jgi:hypothetical protein
MPPSPKLESLRVAGDGRRRTTLVSGFWIFVSAETVSETETCGDGFCGRSPPSPRLCVSARLLSSSHELLSRAHERAQGHFLNPPKSAGFANWCTGWPTTQTKNDKAKFVKELSALDSLVSTNKPFETASVMRRRTADRRQETETGDLL